VQERPQDPSSEEQELDEVRYGDPLHVVIDGIEPGRDVTIEANGGAGTSFAAFVVPDDATIDLSRDAPIAGDWEGVDGEGFLWSMKNPPLGALDLSVTVRVLDEDGIELASDRVERKYINQDIVVESLAQDRTRGVLALPQGDGPFPVVLVFGGSEGGTGTGEFNAMYLASLGYAAMGVGYFGATGLPATLEEVPIEILEEDLAALTADPRIDPERIVVMGGSRGGELALLLGAMFPEIISGVIAQVPSGVVWGAATVNDVSAWTYAGQPLPYMPRSGSFGEIVRDDSGVDHWHGRTMFLDDIEAAQPAELEAATIKVENFDGPILFLAGDDDQLWPSCVLADISVTRRNNDLDRVNCFPNAGHASVGVPGWSTLDSVELFDSAGNYYLVLGGSPQGNAQAIRAGDTATRAFLDDVFGP
jgi:pimeloyl-ACP methyl ester carboxylesterase